ncbi:hypothetical protein [Anoxybacteroides tepidamans]|uniref:hypothetical protein n=1 Tax=Anoxybacteroides tepidamans TaxID=265948 RepID=UPI00048245D2|nr:hypothetical protein [Anoxybacillus tepidamans]
MDRHKKTLLLILFFVFLSYGAYRIIDYLYFLPMFKQETNVETRTINGTKYMLHRLSWRGTTYISDPVANIDDYELGKQIGRTKDGIRVYQAKNDHTTLILQGFMSPSEIYKKETPRP